MSSYRVQKNAGYPKLLQGEDCILLASGDGNADYPSYIGTIIKTSNVNNVGDFSTTWCADYFDTEVLHNE